MKYSDLAVWQKAMDLVVSIYAITTMFPSEERFGISSQARRTAVSIPANIAEGHGRKASGAYLNHISIALGSLMELETHLHLAQRLNFIGSDETASLLAKTDEIGKMLTGLKKSISNYTQ